MTPQVLFPGVHVIIQQTCPGCFVNIRGALDNFKNNIDTKDFIEKVGEIYILAGGVPDFEPEWVKDKHLFITGDCWKLFPEPGQGGSSDEIGQKGDRVSRVCPGLHLCPTQR